MKRVLVISLALAFALVAGQAMAKEMKGFHAMKKVVSAKPMSHDELAKVEGGDLIFGHITSPIFTPSISTFLNEVLLTQLGVGGRSPVQIINQVAVNLTPLASGGVNVSLMPHTFVLAKDLTCVGCFAP